jgi:hypothetical protein
MRVVLLSMGLSIFAIPLRAADKGAGSGEDACETGLAAREVVVSLRAGSTNEASEGRQVMGAVLIDAPPAVVWAVWKDWEGVSAYVPDLRYYKVIHEIRPETDVDGREALIEGLQDVGLHAVRFTLHVRFDRAAWRQEWHLLSSEEMQSWQRRGVSVQDHSWTIRRIEGSGGLEPRENGRKTVFRYAPRFATSLPMPGFLTRRAAEKSLRAFLTGLRDRAEEAQRKAAGSDAR